MVPVQRLTGNIEDLYIIARFENVYTHLRAMQSNQLSCVYEAPRTGNNWNIYGPLVESYSKMVDDIESMQILRSSCFDI